MSARGELLELIDGLRTGAVDPHELAHLAVAWREDVDGPFLRFLADHRGTPAFDPPPSQVPTPPDQFRLPHPADTTLLMDADPTTAPAAGIGPMIGTGGRYRVLGLHRSGGLGAVWRAWDAMVGREVAVKTVRPDRRPSPGQLARFVWEGRVTGRLEHPCIVPVYDLVDADPAAPRYVMRFVTGRTLAEAVADFHRAGAADRLALAALLDAFAAVCRAVAFAHSRGVLHRDIKGQNVVLGAFGEVFLVDWGLARGSADRPADTPESIPAVIDDGPETLFGSLIGTPSFMAPEVAAGGDAVPASDVYGLGAMLYQLLTGQPPYDGGEPRAVVNAVVAGEPPAVRAVNPAAPKPLAAVCAKAMARDPGRRYPTATALADDVKRWLAGEPVGAYPEPLAARIGRWAGRHKPLVAGVMAGLFTAVLGLAVSTGLLAEAEAKTRAAKETAEAEWRRAETERQRAADNYALAHALSERTVERLVEGRLPQLAGSEESRRELVDATLGVYREELARRPADADLRRRAAQLYRYAANIARRLGRYEVADAAYRTATGLAREQVAAAPDDPTVRIDLSLLLSDHAASETAAGRTDPAVRLAAEASAVAAAGPADAPDVRRAGAIAALVTAEARLARQQFPAASAAAEAAVGGFTRLAEGPVAHPYDGVMMAYALSAAAEADRELGRLDEAVQRHSQARRLLITIRAEPPGGLVPVDLEMATCWVLIEHGRTHARKRERLAGRAGADKAGADRTEAVLANLSSVVDVADRLTAHHPDAPRYVELAVAARTTRAALAKAGDPESARADLTLARGRLQYLLRQGINTDLYARTLAAVEADLAALDRR